MSESWRPDETRGLIQERDYQPLARPCRNCGESTSPQKMGEDGWCDNCSQATSKLLTYDAEWSCELSAESLIDYLMNLEMYDEELIQLTARNTGRHALNVLGREAKSEAA